MAAASTPRLSVIVPVYNEERTVEQIVDRLRGIPLALEIIAVDDGSRDGTGEVLKSPRDANRIDILVSQPVNRGEAPVMKGLVLTTDRFGFFNVFPPSR